MTRLHPSILRPMMEGMVAQPSGPPPGVETITITLSMEGAGSVTIDVERVEHTPPADRVPGALIYSDAHDALYRLVEHTWIPQAWGIMRTTYAQQPPSYPALVTLHVTEDEFGSAVPRLQGTFENILPVQPGDIDPFEGLEDFDEPTTEQERQAAERNEREVAEDTYFTAWMAMAPHHQAPYLLRLIHRVTGASPLSVQHWECATDVMPAEWSISYVQADGAPRRLQYYEPEFRSLIAEAFVDELDRVNIDNTPPTQAVTPRRNRRRHIT